MCISNARIFTRWFLPMNRDSFSSAASRRATTLFSHGKMLRKVYGGIRNSSRETKRPASAFTPACAAGNPPKAEATAPSLHNHPARVGALPIAGGIGHRPVVELQLGRPVRPAE